jgi:hypothetical protein
MEVSIFKLSGQGAVLGIDVGFSPKRRSSAVCRLAWSDADVTWKIDRFRAAEPERIDTITRVAGRGPLLAAAFDGPLRRGLDVIGRYRTAERMLTVQLQPLTGKPGQSSSPVGQRLNDHANQCVAIVLEHCEVDTASHAVAIHSRAIVEAFPSSFLGLMIEDPRALNARRGDRSDTFFRHLARNGSFHRLVEHLLPGRSLAADPNAITNHDDRAAFVCALTALTVAAEDYAAVGDEDGWIILPPASFIQSWGLVALRANALKAEEAFRIEQPKNREATE